MVTRPHSPGDADRPAACIDTPESSPHNPEGTVEAAENYSDTA